MTRQTTNLSKGPGAVQLALFLDLFDRMHQLSQQQLASLPHHTPREA
jgi:hypothetical protein